MGRISNRQNRCFCFPCHAELQSFNRQETGSASDLNRPASPPREKLLRLSERDKQLLNEVKRIIEAHPNDEPVHLRRLSRMAGINEYKLKKGFRQLFSSTPVGYFLDLKMSQAKKLLLEPDSTVYGVAYALGYQHASNFCIEFKRRFGVTAGEFKRGG
ncbi:MAG: helix-turn-helix transcriptional regulator [Bacteroidota bacterium]|nr:helix-turn-helix transcriptional regulator [Bacteroidota bacterium]